MSQPEQLVKITAVGTISIPKELRRHMGLQKGDYVKIAMEGDMLVIRKATIT